MQRIVKTITIYLAAAVGLVLFSAVAYGVFTASVPSVGAMLSAICMALVGYGVGLMVRRMTVKNKSRVRRENS